MLLFSLKASHFNTNTFTFHCLSLSNVIVWESHFSSTEPCHWNNDWGFLKCDFLCLFTSLDWCESITIAMWIHHNLTSMWWFYITIYFEWWVCQCQCPFIQHSLFPIYTLTHTLVLIVTKTFHWLVFIANDI